MALKNKMTTWLCSLVCFSMLSATLFPIGDVKANDDPTTQVNEVNVIANAGFEEPVVSGVIPGWSQIWSTSGITIEESLPAGHTGKAMKLVDASTTSAVYLRSDKFPVVQGQTYRLAVDTYIESGAPVMIIYFYDVNGTQLTSVTDGYYGTPSERWTSIYLEAVAPEGAVSAAVMPHSNGVGTCSAYFDDFRIEQIVGPVANAGFEKPLVSGKSQNWTQVFSTTGISVSSNLPDNRAGRALRLEDSSTAGGVYLRSDKIPIQADKRYLLSLDTYIESGAPVIIIYFYDSNGNEISPYAIEGYYGATTYEWKTLYMETKVPVEATHAAVMLHSNGPGTFTGYFDDVSLEMLTSDVPNAGFELPLVNNKIPGWNQIWSTGGITIEDNLPGSRTGKAMKLVDTSTETSVYLRSNKVPISGGNPYLLKVDAYVEQGSPLIYIYYYNQSNELLSSKIKAYYTQPLNEWSTLTFMDDVPADAVYAEIMLHSNSLGTCISYFDNVSYVKQEKKSFNLGPAVHNVGINAAAYGTGPNNEEWTYTVINGATARFFVVDSHTNTIVEQHQLPGGGGSWGLVTAQDGSVYISTIGGKLFRWTPGSSGQQGQMTDLGVAIEGETFLWRLAVDDAGNIYGGTYPNGKVFQYNTETEQFQDYGSVVEGVKYTRSIDWWNGKLYVGLGTEKARLFEVDSITGTKNEIALPSAYANESSVYDVNVRGDYLFARVVNAGAVLVYDLVEEQWIDTLTNISGIDVSPLSSDNKVYMFSAGKIIGYDPVTKNKTLIGEDSRFWSARSFGWVHLNEPDFPGETLISIDAVGRMRMINPTTGSIKIAESQIPGEPTIINWVGTGHDGKIYTSGFQSGGLSAYDPVTDEFYEYPKGAINQIESGLFYDGKLYMGIYPGAYLYSFDFAQPYAIGSNPQSIVGLKAEGQDRPYGFTWSGDVLAMGTVPDYGLLGGALTIYNPEAGNYSVHRQVVENQSIVPLLSKNGLIYGGTSIWGGLGGYPTETEAKLFIWDQALEEVAWEGAPVPGATLISSLEWDKDGNIWGLTMNTLFKFNPTTKETVLTKELYSCSWCATYHAFKPTYLVVDQSGDLYVRIPSGIYRIDAETLEMELLADSGTHLTQDHEGNLYFANGADLYKYRIDRADLYAPVLRNLNPLHQQANVSINKRMIATFDEIIQPGTSFQEVKLYLGDVEVPVQVTASGYDLVIQPNDELINDASYTLSIPASAVQDSSGNLLANATVSTFETRSESISPTWPPQSELFATDISQTSMKLGWSAAIDNVGVSGYKIYLDNQFVSTVSGLSNEYTVASLTENTNFNFKIIAIDAAGNESEALTGTFKTLPYNYYPSNPVQPTVPSEAAEDPDPDDTDTPEASSTNFTDIAGHWAEAVIKEAVDLGIVKGYTDGSFRPKQLISRAEFTSMLVRALKLPASTTAVTYSDVNANAWYTKELAAAYEAGIVKGIDKERFAPNAEISREQMAVMLFRAYVRLTGQTSDASEALDRFIDADRIATWAQDDINQVLAIGLMQGKGNGLFDPEAHTSRAEAIQAILNLLKQK
ncbi:S-layer homology domain-containing protein [Paenibacillus agaridevorans]|nr:S-layer homology domain-containing protein [Paenibacillus agaridevorans]